MLVNMKGWDAKVYMFGDAGSVRNIYIYIYTHTHTHKHAHAHTHTYKVTCYT